MNNFAQAVDLILKAEMQGTPHHESFLSLGQTPNYLIEHGAFSNKDLIITGKVLTKAHFDHAVPASILKRLPSIIEEPKSLFKSATQQNCESVVVLTFEIVNRTLPLVIPIHKDKKMTRTGTYNVIASVYGKDNGDPSPRWIKQGLHLWSPKTKTGKTS